MTANDEGQTPSTKKKTKNKLMKEIGNRLRSYIGKTNHDPIKEGGIIK